MKIAFVLAYPFEPRSQNGSISIWTYNVARRLARYHDVVVYSPRGYHQRKIEYIEGVKYRRISASFDYLLGYVVKGASKRFPGLNRAQRKRPYFASIFSNLAFILKVAKDLQIEKCDIVHIQEESEFITIIRALNPAIRIVLHMHCEWLNQLDHRMIEHRIRKADLILGCSRYITEKIRESFPSLAGRCHTLYNGVDLVTFTNDPKKNEKKLGHKQLLFVSRVTPEKGLHVLLEAFKEVAEKDACVCLDIVGPLDSWTLESVIWLSEDSKVQGLAGFHRKGSLRGYFDYLTHRLLSLNMMDSVAFHGLIPHEQKIRLYQAADIFIQPSAYPEPFGMGIIEAMACQVPVVATKAGGIPEIVEDGKTGLLVNPRDSHELANAILKLLSNDELNRKIVENGRKRAEFFSWDNVVTNSLSLYRNMLNDVDTVSHNLNKAER